MKILSKWLPPCWRKPSTKKVCLSIVMAFNLLLILFPPAASEQAGATPASASLVLAKAFSAFPPGEVMLHVSSYKEKANAEDEVQRLKKYGYKSFLAEEEVSGERWFRVYIGTFTDEEEARKVGSELKTRGLISYFKPTKLDQSVTVAKKVEPRTAPLARAPKEVIETKTEPTRKKDDLVKKQRIAIAEPEKEEIQKPSPTIKEESIQSDRDSKSRFSISLKSGIFFPGKSGEFEITKRGTSNNDKWNISGDTALDVAVVPSFRFNRRLSLDAGFEGILAGNINLTFLTLGPKIVFGSSNRFFPYLNAGAVYGSFDWDGAPGNFKDSAGWEAGFGMDFLDSQLKVGIHFLYRNIQFDYEAPSGQQVTANQGSIDFTGYYISALLRYYF